jgi:hypothetical protein
MRTKYRVLLFLCMTILAVRSVAVLEASRGYSSQQAYFSDSSMTEVVGEGYVDCNWHFTLYWGQVTNYIDSSDDTCGGGSGGVRWCPGGCPTGWFCTPYGCTVSGTGGD